MFQTLGLNPQKEVTSKNVAAVIVTAKLPAFGRLGQKLDVTVSSIGDASSLAGGTLFAETHPGGGARSAHSNRGERAQDVVLVPLARQCTGA